MQIKIRDTRTSREISTWISILANELVETEIVSIVVVALFIYYYLLPNSAARESQHINFGVILEWFGGGGGGERSQQAAPRIYLFDLDRARIHHLLLLLLMRIIG